MHRTSAVLSGVLSLRGEEFYKSHPYLPGRGKFSIFFGMRKPVRIIVSTMKRFYFYIDTAARWGPKDDEIVNFQVRLLRSVSNALSRCAARLTIPIVAGVSFLGRDKPIVALKHESVNRENPYKCFSPELFPGSRAIAHLSPCQPHGAMRCGVSAGPELRGICRKEGRWLSSPRG